MSCSNNDYLFIITIIIIFFVCWIIFKSNNRNETFAADLYPKEFSCNKCERKDRKSCGECINCGFCFTGDGYGKCVHGNEDGPFFGHHCWDYEYRTPIVTDDLYYLHHPRGRFWDDITKQYVLRNWDDYWHGDWVDNLRKIEDEKENKREKEKELEREADSDNERFRLNQIQQEIDDVMLNNSKRFTP
jgi:hypothetical protein